MTKVISNEVMERLENTFLYINLFIGDSNNSIDKLPQILNNKSEMKSCVTNIRNSIRKINKFIIGNKTKNELINIFKNIKFNGYSSVSGKVAWFSKIEIIKNYIERNKDE